MSDDILSLKPPPADARVPYGSDPNQFIDLRFPAKKEPAHPLVINIHGGFWRSAYGLDHAGHLCAALTAAGLVSANLEYRRVGNAGGGWPGTFDDIRAAYRFVRQQAARFRGEADRIGGMGDSAGAQLALCLAAHEESARSVISLAGVLDLKKAYALHLSQDAVVEFLGGKPEGVS